MPIIAAGNSTAVCISTDMDSICAMTGHRYLLLLYVNVIFFLFRWISQLNYCSTLSMNQLIHFFSLQNGKLVTHLTNPGIATHTKSRSRTRKNENELKPFSVHARIRACLILSASCWQRAGLLCFFPEI